MSNVKKYNPNHDAKGRFASGSGGSMSGHVMASRLRSPDGGFTVDPYTGAEPKTGFVVAIHPDREHIINEDMRKITPDKILREAVNFREKNKDVLGNGNNLGAWHDPETNKGYFDVSAVVSTREEAEKLSREYGQIAYFDLTSGESVKV